MKKLFMGIWLVCMLVLPVVSLAQEEGFMTSEQVVEFVRDAQGDVTIELEADMSFSERQALRNDHGATVHILGNGFNVSGLALSSGKYLLENLTADQILFAPDGNEVDVAIAEDCVIHGRLVALGLVEGSSGVVRIDNAGEVWGFQTGLMFSGENTDLYVNNRGIIAALQGLALGDGGSANARVFDICNTGEIRGMLLAGADLAAMNRDTKVSIYGGGVLSGSIGAVVGGRGQILIDQHIVANKYGTINEQEKYQMVYEAFYAYYESTPNPYLIGRLMGEFYSLVLDEVNGQAVVDRGAVWQRYKQLGSLSQEATRDNGQNQGWHSPVLTIRGTMEKQGDVIGDVYLPRDAALCIESEIEYVKTMRLICETDIPLDDDHIEQLKEEAIAYLQNISLGAMEDQAMLYMVRKTEDVYSAGTGDLMYAAYCGKLSDLEFSKAPYWEVAPMSSADTSRYGVETANRLNYALKNSRVFVDRDVSYIEGMPGMISPRNSGVILDGGNHRINYDYNFMYDSKNEMTIENFSQLHRLEVTGGKLTVRNTELTGIFTVTNHSINGVSKTEVILDDACFNSDSQYDQNGHMMVETDRGTVVLSILEGSEIIDDYLQFIAEKDAAVSVVNEGIIRTERDLVLEARGGKVSLTGSGRIIAGDVYLQGEQGGKVVFAANAERVTLDAGDGKKFSAEIDGSIGTLVLRFDAANSTGCSVKVNARVSGIQIQIQDDAREKPIDQGNVKQYLKQTLPKLNLSGAEYEQNGKLYVYIQYAGGYFSDFVEL